MAGLCPPLPTLRARPRGRQRTARGRCGSLLLHRNGLAPSTPCRSPGAREAKQSISPQRKTGLRRRFAPLRKRFAFVAGNDIQQCRDVRRAYLTASARVNPMILGKAPVWTGSAFAVSGGTGALAVASGNRVFISRRNPSSVSTLAAILAIRANSALLAATGLPAVSKAANR